MPLTPVRRSCCGMPTRRSTTPSAPVPAPSSTTRPGTSTTPAGSRWSRSCAPRRAPASWSSTTSRRSTVATGRTVGVEALVRWQHPTRGLLGPAEFVPLAEVHGLMGVVTDVVLSQAVAQAAQWRGDGLDLRISVNLSASNLLDTALPERVDGLLRTYGVSPSSLVLEVTETVLMSDPDRSLAVVGALTELGTTVSIDDFGTGYAS